MNSMRRSKSHSLRESTSTAGHEVFPRCSDQSSMMIRWMTAETIIMATYNEKNGGAKKLWNAVAAPYNPEVYHLNVEETVFSFKTAEKIIAACGNDCAVCPRYND